MRALVALILFGGCSYNETVGSNIAVRNDANTVVDPMIDAPQVARVWDGFLATGMAVHNDDVYWIDTLTLPNVMHTVDRYGSIAGVLPPEPRFGPGIAADADHVYVAAQLASAEWGVLAYDVHTSTTTPLLSGVTEPIGEIGVSHGNLYYLTSPAAAPTEMIGALRVVPLGGGASSVVIGQLSTPARLRFDDNYVYVVDSYQGRLLAAGAQGTLVVAEHLDAPSDVTADGDYLYVVERAVQPGDGRIIRIARPHAGATQPQLDTTVAPIVSGLDLPMQAVVEGGMLYWTSYEAGLYRAPVLGGQVQQVANEAGPGYGPIVLRSDHRMLFASTAGNHSYIADFIPL